MQTHTIFLIGGAEEETATITAEERDNLCHINFQYRDRSIEADATDYFEALCKVRIQLEAEGLIPFCYGASLNVYPSSMCRDMGGGSMAYRLTQGRPALRADLVRIFDSGPDVMPSSVANQKENYSVWIKSLKA